MRIWYRISPSGWWERLCNNRCDHFLMAKLLCFVYTFFKVSRAWSAGQLMSDDMMYRESSGTSLSSLYFVPLNVHSRQLQFVIRIISIITTHDRWEEIKEIRNKQQRETSARSVNRRDESRWRKFLTHILAHIIVNMCRPTRRLEVFFFCLVVTLKYILKYQRNSLRA